jgi:hypothetical protein
MKAESERAAQQLAAKRQTFDVSFGLLRAPDQPFA